MVNAPSAEAMETTFKTLVEAAVAGRRCPANTAIGINRSAIPALARAGRIRVDIHLHNWRVVTILEWPARGKSTAPCPSKSRPWKTVGIDTVVNGKGASNPAHRQPSKPRPLPADYFSRRAKP